MGKRVILTLEYDMGDYSDMEEDGQEISLDPSKWAESFYQSDVLIDAMKIVSVRVEGGKGG